jgi:putative transposase
VSRPLRIEFPGALYHITSRGNDRAAIFLVDSDRHQFLETLGEVVGRCGWRCHAYCLMTNHYHLVVENTAGEPLGRNAPRQRALHPALQPPPRACRPRLSGPVPRGLVERETHFLELAR